jgi:FKBP-type peptidyl-prolyl cis-trans isomerase
MVVDGGLTKSNYLLQLQSNIMNQDIDVCSYSDCTPLGVGLGAGFGAGYFRSYAEMKKLSPETKSVKVSDDHRPAYRRYAIMRDIILQNTEKLNRGLMTQKHSIDNMATTYRVTMEGSGDATVQDGLLIEVHATGYLADGITKFCSTHNHNKPMSYHQGTGLLIAGLEAGIAGAKVGELRTVYIPAAEGYGATSAGDTIPPNSDIIFEIAVIKIDDKGKASLFF